VQARASLIMQQSTQAQGDATRTADSMANQTKALKNTFTDTATEIGMVLVPAALKIVSVLNEQVIPWVKTFIGSLSGDGGGGGGSSLQGAFSSVKTFIVDIWWPAMKATFDILRDTFNAVVATFRAKEPEIRQIMGGVVSAVRGIFTVFQEVILPILRFVFTEVLPRVIGVAIEAIAKITSAISGIAGFISGIRDKFSAFWEWLRSQSLKAALDVVEPFSHLPGKMGGWARSAKDEINKQLDKIQTEKEIRISAKIFASLSQGAQNAPDNNPRGDPRNPNQLAGTANGLIDSYMSGNLGSMVRSLPIPSVGAVATGGGGGNLMGASPVMGPFASGAAAYGLAVSSGLRPGAITANGTPSDHGIGKAIDVSNTYQGDPDGTPQMAAFFKSLLGNPGVKQAFYDPLGSIFRGAWSSYREGGHTDHVHVATYDRGGVLPPGLTLAYNGTGRNEYVNRGDQPLEVMVYLDGEQIWQSVQRRGAAWTRRNGGDAFR